MSGRAPRRSGPRKNAANKRDDAPSGLGPWSRLPFVAKGVVAVVSGIGVLAGGFQAVRTYVDRTVRADAAAESKLGRLSVNVQVSEFDRILGPARIKNPGATVIEYVYTDPKFLVQAVTTTSDKVIFYSVTSRRTDFHPIFQQFHSYHSCPDGVGKVCDIARAHLNDTPFAGYQPNGVAATNVGMRLRYAEAYGGSHADNFLTFLLISNDVGCQVGGKHATYDYANKVLSVRTGSFVQPFGSVEALPPSVTDLRDFLVPNAYAVATSDFELAKFSDDQPESRSSGDRNLMVYGPKSGDLAQVSGVGRPCLSGGGN